MSYTFSSLFSLFSLLSFPTVFRMDFSALLWLRRAGLVARLPPEALAQSYRISIWDDYVWR